MGKRPGKIKNRDRDLDWKDMTAGQKIRQYRDYYLVPTIVAVILLGAAIYIAWSVTHPEPEAELSVILVDSGISGEGMAEMKRDMAQILGTKEERIRITPLSAFSYYTPMQITIYLQNSEVDVLVGDRLFLEQYGEEDAFRPADSLYSEDELAAWAKDLVTYDVDITGEMPQSGEAASDETEVLTEESACGVCVNAAERWMRLSAVPEADAVCAVTNASKKPENAAAFVRYLMGE